MPRSINVVVLSGNLTADPEVKEVSSGALANLRLAVNGSKKVDDQWVDVPNYFNVTVFGKQAEWCAEHSKGEALTVKGRLQWREWESGGSKRSAVDVVAEDLNWAQRGSAPTSAPADDGPVF